MCAVMCLITVGKYRRGICWVKTVSVIGREWCKGCDASLDTQTSIHPGESLLLPKMPKLSMEGAESRKMVKETRNTGRQNTAIWDKNSKSIEDANGVSVGIGKASAAPPHHFLSIQEGESIEDPWSISLSYSGALPLHPDLAHLLSFRAIILTQALPGVHVAHSAQLILCTGIYILI